MWVNLKFIYGSQQIGFTIFGQRFLSKQGLISSIMRYVNLLLKQIGKRCKSVLRQWVIFYNQLSVWWVFSMGLIWDKSIIHLFTNLSAVDPSSNLQALHTWFQFHRAVQCMAHAPFGSQYLVTHLIWNWEKRFHKLLNSAWIQFQTKLFMSHFMQCFISDWVKSWANTPYLSELVR